MKNDVIAIVTGDLHLSHKCPVARSDEDWFEIQIGYLNQLTELQHQYDNEFLPKPIIVCGDLFDQWNPPIGFVNQLLEEMSCKKIFAIPGNHDLRHHSYVDRRESGYWNLVKHGRITNIDPDEPYEYGNMILHGFPPGYEVEPLEKSHDLCLNVAVIHSYIWTASTGYKDAPEETRLKKWLPKLKGYDVALFGDNHLCVGWNMSKEKEGPSIWNSGTFIRRKADEKKYRPSVGLLYEDGTIKVHYLDISKDQFATNYNESKEDQRDFSSLVKELSELGDAGIDFPAAVRRALQREDVEESVKKIALAALEEIGK